jgi:beta-glucosidase
MSDAGHWWRRRASLTGWTLSFLIVLPVLLSVLIIPDLGIFSWFLAPDSPGTVSMSSSAASVPLEEWLTAQVASMSLSQKFGQMTQVGITFATPAEIEAFGCGSVLSGGGNNPPENNPTNWRAQVHNFTSRAPSGLPLLYGVDAVHGHNNCRGCVIFPHNIGLGATRDAELLQRIGHAVGLECRATGVHWNFAPCVAVVQDVRWGRSYESFSSDTRVVTELGTAFARGLLAAGIMPCLKHFIGDGGTTWGSKASHGLSTLPPPPPALPTREPRPWDPAAPHPDSWHMDTTDCVLDEERVRSLFLPPYEAGIRAGVLSVMASFSSWHGQLSHGSKFWLTDVLKGELQFAGFVVSDWGGIDALSPNYTEAVALAINAGIDMVMVPIDGARFLRALAEAVAAGAIPLARIDDAVRRILRAKVAVGLLGPAGGAPSPFQLADLAAVGSRAHRELAAEAVRKSLVLLQGRLRVLTPAEPLVLLGPTDDIGLACGGWTITWQGAPGPITEGTTLAAACRARHAPDHLFFSLDAVPAAVQPAAVVVIAEQPYAEGFGDRNWAALVPTAAEVALIQAARSRSHHVTLLVYSGRPLDLRTVAPDCDTIIAAWLPGSEAGPGITQLLYGDYPLHGQLPVPWTGF